LGQRCSFTLLLTDPIFLDRIPDPDPFEKLDQIPHSDPHAFFLNGFFTRKNSEKKFKKSRAFKVVPPTPHPHS
jgi:hypothetical protein